MKLSPFGLVDLNRALDRKPDMKTAVREDVGERRVLHEAGLPAGRRTPPTLFAKEPEDIHLVRPLA